MTASRAGQGVPRLLEPSPRRTSTALRDASHTAPESGADARGRRSGARSVARGTPDLPPAARPATTVEPPVSPRVPAVHAAALPSPLRPRSARRCSPRASLDARTPRIPHVPVLPLARLARRIFAGEAGIEAAALTAHPPTVRNGGSLGETASTNRARTSAAIRACGRVRRGEPASDQPGAASGQTAIAPSNCFTHASRCRMRQRARR